MIQMGRDWMKFREKKKEERRYPPSPIQSSHFPVLSMRNFLLECDGIYEFCVVGVTVKDINLFHCRECSKMEKSYEDWSWIVETED